MIPIHRETIRALGELCNDASSFLLVSGKSKWLSSYLLCALATSTNTKLQTIYDLEARHLGLLGYSIYKSRVSLAIPSQINMTEGYIAPDLPPTSK